MNEAIGRIVAEMRSEAILTSRANFTKQEVWDFCDRLEAIAQQPSNASRGGYVMAPVVPTEAMIKAGYDAMNKHVAIGILPGDVYAAMMATLGEWQ